MTRVDKLLRGAFMTAFLAALFVAALAATLAVVGLARAVGTATARPDGVLVAPVTPSAPRTQPQFGVQFTLQSQAVANGNGSAAMVDGFNGAQVLQIDNGAGTCTVTIQGSFDPAFANAQDVATVGVSKRWDSTGGVVTTRSLSSGAISVAANTSYYYDVSDAYPYVRAVISSAAGLGAGTSSTGCTVQIYAEPVQ